MVVHIFKMSKLLSLTRLWVLSAKSYKSLKEHCALQFIACICSRQFSWTIQHTAFFMGVHRVGLSSFYRHWNPALDRTSATCSGTHSAHVGLDRTHIVAMWAGFSVLASQWGTVPMATPNCGAVVKQWDTEEMFLSYPEEPHLHLCQWMQDPASGAKLM